jgi:6-phospho-beta-glucosidase
MITAHGPEPFAWGSFNPIAKGLLQNLKEMEILTVEAALEGNYEVLENMDGVADRILEEFEK